MNTQASNSAFLFAFVCAALLASVGGCGHGYRSAGEPAPAPVEVANEDTIVCANYTFENPDGTKRTENEWYRLTAMNNKLRHFPEFAAATGLQPVSNCEGARAFQRAYGDYTLSHPGFDDRQPLDEAPFAIPTPPTLTTPEVQLRKILAGTPVQLQ